MAQTRLNSYYPLYKKNYIYTNFSTFFDLKSKNVEKFNFKKNKIKINLNLIILNKKFFKIFYF